jgi:Family of unknown function (DUF6428)
MTPSIADDLTLSEVLALADVHADLPLIFHHDGRPVKPGYHVTEVKAGQFAALDCGANPEAWAEIFVQLWDVNEDARAHMASGKFAKIIRKVADHVGLDAAARLTFEVSDGVAPMQLHRATQPEVRDGALHVALLPRAASCKPRDRWLETHGPAKARACC